VTTQVKWTDPSWLTLWYLLMTQKNNASDINYFVFASSYICNKLSASRVDFIYSVYTLKITDSHLVFTTTSEVILSWYLQAERS